MPRLSVPPAMSQEVSRAIEIIGNRARATIVRHIVLNGPSSATELATEVGAAREAVYVHLMLMEKTGVVTRAVREGGQPNAAYFGVDRDRVEQLYALWHDYTLGK